jgi:hypothetical protein
LSLNFNGLQTNPLAKVDTTPAVVDGSSNATCKDASRPTPTPEGDPGLCSIRLGRGFARTDCCAQALEKGFMCCTYSAANDLKPTTEILAEGQVPAGTTKFTLTYYLKQGTGSDACLIRDTRTYKTTDICSAASKSIKVNSSTATANNCAGKDVGASPQPASVYNQISKLQSCPQ